MITREFLESEIIHLEKELNNSQILIFKIQGVLESYKMLLTKLEEKKEEL
jgi:hypothetical protein